MLTLLKKPVLFFAFWLCLGSLHAQVVKKPAPSIVKDNADEYYDAAVREAKLKNYRKAIQYGRLALDQRPVFSDMELLLGRLYFITKRYDSARKYLKAVIMRDPRYKDAYLYAINIELTTHNYDEALCFADDALYYFPNDSELMLKKLSILEVMRRYRTSSAYADKILDKYPNDGKVILTYVDHKLTLGRFYMNRGNMTQARYHFEAALSVDPGNPEAIAALFNLEVRTGNQRNALDKINYALLQNPRSYELLMSKLDVLRSMREYAEALEVMRTLMRYYPGDARVNSLEVDLRLEAGHYYSNMDPYLQFLSVLEREPANSEALSKVISIAVSRGNYKDALIYINRALRTNPNDPVLLGNKLDLLEFERNFAAAAEVAEDLYRVDRSIYTRSRLADLKVASGRYYMSQQVYDTAMIMFERALELSPNNFDALESLVNLHITRKNFDEALNVINRAVELYPEDEKLLLKKATVLNDLGRIEESAVIMEQLITENPQNKKYQGIYVEQRLVTGRDLMQQEEFEMAKQHFHEVLKYEPSNLDALNYMINLESAMDRLDSALYHADRALIYHPDNRDVLLKKAGILDGLKRYREAYQITETLIEKYPYNKKYRETYIEQLLGSGRNYRNDSLYDSALSEFAKVLYLSPRDSNALAYSINILAERRMYDSALALINRGLTYYPGNPHFLMKRAAVLENKREFGLAALAADSVAKLIPTPANIDYARMLRSQGYKNQFGLFFLSSSYDDGSPSGKIATIEYRRFIRKGSYAVRMNYAGRLGGNGIQFDGELYYNHDSTSYSYGVASVSDGKIFPYTRLGYSYFRNFKNGIEGEAGVRFLKTADITGISVVASASKEFGEFWTNLRGFAIWQDSRLYPAALLTTRYYMNDLQKDYLSVLFGMGNSPDDPSRNIFLNTGTPSKTIGVGYNKVFAHRNTVSLNFTWINQRTTTTSFRNQYDIYLTYQRKF